MRGFEICTNRKNPNKTITIPRRADKGSAGYDFCTPTELFVDSKCSVLVWTDIKAYMLEDEVLEMHIRSSMGTKLGLQLKNTVGIIDSSYYNNEDNEGNIGICLYNNSDEYVIIEEGTRIAQGIFKKYLIADNDETMKNNRTGGFGSSGN